MSSISFESGSKHDTQLKDVTIHILIFIVASFFSLVLTKILIGFTAKYFLTKTKLYGIDMGKHDKIKVPESLGIVVGITFLVSYLTWFVITPVLLKHYTIISGYPFTDKECSMTSNFYNNGLGDIAAMTSIFAMLMLGFIDDCYDLRWRYKILFPLAASIPLVGVYYYNFGKQTDVVIPKLLQNYFGMNPYINLGLFYYIYMFMFVIFCTNAINIYAGINGLEVGQSLVLTVTILIYNLIGIMTSTDCNEWHIFSIQLLLPFLFGSYALYEYNRYPAQVFVGDSYCYFAGITLAVVGIFGHFSEEILAFAIPQVFNFLLSIPQIFKFIPCPRHRLPHFNRKTGLMEPSTFEFKYSDLSRMGQLSMKVYTFFKLANPILLQKDDDIMVSNNLTLLNLWLHHFGPRNEKKLCHQVLFLQASLSAFCLSIMSAIKLGLL